MKKFCQEKIKLNREKNTRNMTCRHVSNIDAWVVFGNSYVPSSVTEYHLCTISCVKIESLELSGPNFSTPIFSAEATSFMMSELHWPEAHIRSSPSMQSHCLSHSPLRQDSLSKASHRPGQEEMGVPYRKTSRLNCHAQFEVVHFTMYYYCTYNCTMYIVHLTMPCIVHVYPQQEMRGIQHVCLGSHVAKGRKLRPQILKEPKKIHADSCTIYSCTLVSLAGPNFRRIYKIVK